MAERNGGGATVAYRYPSKEAAREAQRRVAASLAGTTVGVFTFEGRATTDWFVAALADSRKELAAARKAAWGDGKPVTDVELPGYVGTSEAAEILGVERPRIGRWIKRGVMPLPAYKLAATPVWERAQIVALRARRLKLSRRRETSDTTTG